MSSLSSKHRKRALLQALPQSLGLPILGNTLASLRDPGGLMLRLATTHGPVVRTRFFGEDTVVLLGPEANQQVFRNEGDVFSSTQGWAFYIERFFHRGLMLLDFDEHRFHRGIMQGAFKKPYLVHYLARMNPVIARGLARWRPGARFMVYPQLKQLTLDIATEVFMGEQLGPEADRINRAFVNCVLAGSAVLRFPVPGLRWQRGIAGRQVLEAFFRERIASKRAQPGDDLFSRLCQAEDEQGQRFSDDDVINHMIFLMMAAHDTTTITLSSVMYFLARHPEWQARVREEALSIGRDALQHEDLAKLTVMDQVMKESLRLISPVHVLPRRTVKEVEVAGHVLPADTAIVIAPLATHHMTDWWTAPEHFDPERFSAERQEHKRHPGQFVPFGGGAHMCIGLHFGDMEVKALLHQLVLQFTWQVPANYAMAVNFTSLPRPSDHLPVMLTRIATR